MHHHQVSLGDTWPRAQRPGGHFRWLPIPLPFSPAMCSFSPHLSPLSQHLKSPSLSLTALSRSQHCRRGLLPSPLKGSLGLRPSSVPGPGGTGPRPYPNGSIPPPDFLPPSSLAPASFSFQGFPSTPRAESLPNFSSSPKPSVCKHSPQGSPRQKEVHEEEPGAAWAAGGLPEEPQPQPSQQVPQGLRHHGGHPAPGELHGRECMARRQGSLQGPKGVPGVLENGPGL